VPELTSVLTETGLTRTSQEAGRLTLVIEIGGTPVRINTSDPKFHAILQDRYAGFISNSKDSERVEIEFDAEIVEPGFGDTNADVQVAHRQGQWSLRRGDFRAGWDTALRTGSIRLSANSYSIDSVLRIFHTLVLARQGGFLLHAASALRNGKAFLFAGVSGAGKTTISSLAPADAILLTDEISYIRRRDAGYVAFGTPFTGELDKLGENISAPVVALYLLAKGTENRIEPVSPAEAARALLANILFFAEDEELVQSMFHSAFEFASRVPVSRLTFVPDARVWELIG
jgi:hypothetical protein